MNFINQLTIQLEMLSQKIPVEAFTFIGALVEEIIAPIPSPIVMTAAGSVAGSQGKSVLYLLVLAMIGAIGKIIGSLILYYVADKAEDFFVGKFGRLVGIKQSDIESLSKHFGEGKKDFLVVFLARLIPIVPTAPISVVAGLLHLNVKNYLSASFLGYLGRNFIYLYFGYVGYESFHVLVEGLDSIESIMTILIGLGMVFLIGWFYYRRMKYGEESILQKISQTRSTSDTEPK